jgi:hypothetical protein
MESAALVSREMRGYIYHPETEDFLWAMSAPPGKCSASPYIFFAIPYSIYEMDVACIFKEGPQRMSGLGEGFPTTRHDRERGRCRYFYTGSIN